MKRTFGFLAALLVAQGASAADIFVRDAKGSDVDSTRATEVTDMVKTAVRGMDEHSLVNSEANADFVLQPRIADRDGEEVLILERYQDGQLVSSNEQPLNGSDVSTLAQNTLDSDAYVYDSEGDLMAAGNDVTAPETAPQRSIASSPHESSESGSSSKSTSNSDSQKSIGILNQGEEFIGGSDQPTISGSDRAPASASASAADQPASDESTMGGASVAQGPRQSRLGGPGYFTVGFGPSFAVGLENDNVLYDINAGYNIDFTPSFTAKAMADFNLGTGDDDSRWINLAVGGNFYPSQLQFGNGRPYVMGDIGYGFVRDNDSKTQDAIAVGAGAGFQFQAQALNLDLNLHYSILTSQIDDENPQILGLRVALNF